MLVRLVFPKKWKGLFRLLPDNNNQIGDVTFTTDEVDEADLVVIANFSPYKIKMRAREAWIFHQEPGNRKFFGHWIKAYKHADRVFGSWKDLKESECEHFYKSQSSIVWVVNNSYNFYKSLDSKKTTLLSTVTSSKTVFEGHKERLEFLYSLKKEFKDTKYDFEIKGSGISPVETKDEVLIPSKYTLCIENTSESHYFTEKISDAFLCNCMPIYYGAPNIFEYFPKNSLIMLEDFDVLKAKEIIKYVIDNNLYEKNYSSIMEAKNLVLNKYNFFMNIMEKIKEFDILNIPKKDIYIPKGHQKKHPHISKIKHIINKSMKS